MACETQTKPRQTISQRADEVQRTIVALDALMKKRIVKVTVGPQGAVTFTGWSDKDRDGVTDACAYRRLMVSGSALAKMEIARAEQLAGRSVDRRVLASGTHSHDGGRTWGSGHK